MQNDNLAEVKRIYFKQTLESCILVILAAPIYIALAVSIGLAINNADVGIYSSEVIVIPLMCLKSISKNKEDMYEICSLLFDDCDPQAFLAFTHDGIEYYKKNKKPLQYHTYSLFQFAYLVALSNNQMFEEALEYLYTEPIFKRKLYQKVFKLYEANLIINQAIANDDAELAKSIYKSALKDNINFKSIYPKTLILVLDEKWQEVIDLVSQHNATNNFEIVIDNYYLA